MYGSYQSLSGGQISDALTDLTGGVVERFDMRKEIPEDLFYIMFKSIEHGSLLSCSIDVCILFCVCFFLNILNCMFNYFCI